MIAPATRPRAASAFRMLVVERASGAMTDARVAELPSWLRAGDLLVVNDAATLPASLALEGEGGLRLEARLAQPPDAEGRALALLFGPGSWRERTEDRAPAPELAPGTTLALEDASRVRVERLDPRSPRLVTLRFEGAWWRSIYRVGARVQYSYLERELEPWDVETVYAARPWAVEPPSAGLALTHELLGRLLGRSVELASITHAAGLSSTGDAELDRVLPLAERSEVSARTLSAVERARARGGRVVAVGTSVVRALEAAEGPGVREVSLRIDASTRLRRVDALLTGVHAPGESHHELLGALLAPERLALALARAAADGYASHELGDTMLVL